VFYERVNRILEKDGFDRFVEDACEKFYAPVMGRPGVVPGVYFRMLLVGYCYSLRWERRTTSPVTYTAEYSELTVHRLGVAPLNGWALYRELGTIPPAGTGNDAFLMAQNESVSTLKSLDRNYRTTAENDRSSAECVKKVLDVVEAINRRTEEMDRTLALHCDSSARTK